MYAIAQLQGQDIEGLVRFFDQQGTTLVQVTATGKGLTDGQHGFHIHQFGDRSNGCESMGPHYSEIPQRHGGRHSSVRHTGDLGNVVAKNGEIDTMFTVELRVKPLLGRGIVLHADPDDLGLGTADDSGTTGHSGKRIACGIIALADAKQMQK